MTGISTQECSIKQMVQTTGGGKGGKGVSAASGQADFCALPLTFAAQLVSDMGRCQWEAFSKGK